MSVWCPQSCVYGAHYLVPRKLELKVGFDKTYPLLCEKNLNTEIFLVQIQEKTDQEKLRVWNPHFHAVRFPSSHSK